MADGLREVQGRIGGAIRAVGRSPGEVTLVAVSKTFPARAVCAAVACGQRHFGESYAQEAVPKIAEVEALLAAPEAAMDDNLHGPLVWHFIGPIQSNKTREISAHFDWVHGIDREKIARRLSEQRPDGMPPLNACIQVNISSEASKGGVAPDEVAALAGLVSRLPRLKLRGLMSIPKPGADPRSSFRELKKLRDELNAQGWALDTLSMGMSGDFELAIEEGATIIRVGSAIFGNRNYDK